MAPPPLQRQGEVSISIVRDPALVRTVRLVTAMVARRAKCTEALVEEIRLAVGEACALMIGANGARPDAVEQVEVVLAADEMFRVRVTGRVEDDDSDFRELGLDPWALLGGLSDDLAVTDDSGLTTLQMSWPR